MARLSPDRTLLLSALQLGPVYKPHPFTKRHGRSPYCRICGQAEHYRLHKAEEQAKNEEQTKNEEWG